MSDAPMIRSTTLVMPTKDAGHQKIGSVLLIAGALFLLAGGPGL
ncbi:MAG: hypothetical protein ACTHN5_17330 [Phycisphaerae bacterium]